MTESSPGTPSRRVLTGVALFGAVILFGELGYLLAGWTPGDALYMVVITIFGVGYGEVQPITSWQLRLFTIVVIMSGYGAVLYTIGGFLQALVDGELNRHLGARRMTRDIERLEGHTIICGFGRMGASLAKDLSRSGTPFVALDAHEDAFEGAPDDYLHLTGDATEEWVLEQAGIARASVLAIVLANDATSVFITLTARAMNADIRIIARGEQPSTIDKLHRCGADQVVLPTTIGAAKMSQLITRPTADEVLARLVGDGEKLEGAQNLDFTNLGLAVTEVEVPARSTVIGMPLGDVRVQGRADHLVVGLRRADGSTMLDPSPNTTVQGGDRLVVVGYHEDEAMLSRDTGTATFTYRGAKTT